MSRTLRALLGVVFVLALALPSAAGPDDVFDASLPGALKPGEQERLLAADGGRYRLDHARVLDARDPEPALHPLTNARVAALLAADPAAKRGPTPGEEAAARELARFQAKPPEALNFDGGAVRKGGLAEPATAPDGGRGPAGAAVLAPSPARLQAQFLQRLVIAGTPREQAAVGEAVSALLETKTGRDLAAEFVAEKASAEVRVAAIEGSKTITQDGKRVLQGSAGHTNVRTNPPIVTLSLASLDTDPDYRRVTMAGTLAHELLGHAFETQRAIKAGLPPAAIYYYRGDELGAELIDWSLQTELAGKVADGDPDGFLLDPEAYYRSLWTADEYYVMTLSTREMKRPLPALKARRKVFAADRASVDAGIKGMQEWKPIIEHFIRVHGIPKERLQESRDEVDNYLSWATEHRKKLDVIRTTLEQLIAKWSSPDGAAEMRKVTAAADSRYLALADARLAARTKALRKLRAEAAARRRPASEPAEVDLTGSSPEKPKPDGGIDLAELGRLYQKDREEHPEHW